jgi:hypothetical protein
MLIVTTLGTFAVAASVYVGMRNDQTADDALAETRAEQRAWFGAPKIERDKTRRGGTWGFAYTSTNSGKEPPRGLYVGAHLALIGPSYPATASDEAGKDCDLGIAARTSRTFRESTVIPGDALKLKDEDGNPAIRTTFHRSDYDKRARAHLHIVGCIVYVTADRQLRHTKFASPLDFSTGKPVPAPPYTLDAK